MPARMVGGATAAHFGINIRLSRQYWEQTGKRNPSCGVKMVGAAISSSIWSCFSEGGVRAAGASKHSTRLLREKTHIWLSGSPVLLLFGLAQEKKLQTGFFFNFLRAQFVWRGGSGSLSGCSAEPG